MFSRACLQCSSCPAHNTGSPLRTFMLCMFICLCRRYFHTSIQIYLSGRVESACVHITSHIQGFQEARVCSYTGRVGQRSEVTYRCTVTIDCGLMLPTEKLWFNTCVTAAGNPGKVEWGGSCVYGNSFLVCLLFGRREYRCALMTLIPPQRKRKF